MEAVLPLKCASRGNDLDRARLLFFSIGSMWRGSKLLVHIISPSDDLERIRAELSGVHERISIELHDENDLVDGIGANRIGGWVKQQVIKLAAHSLVSEGFYLCLDADLVCVKPISEALLIPDGRAVTGWTGRGGFPAWWRKSAEILDVECNMDALGMGVTPQFFATPVMQQLTARLKARLGRDFWHTLMAPLLAFLDKNGQYAGWTEYSLYNLFAESEGLMSRYHLSLQETIALGRRMTSAQSIWFRDQFSTWKPELAFGNDDPGMFMVCQSNTGLSAADVMDRLRPFFPGAPEFGRAAS